MREVGRSGAWICLFLDCVPLKIDGRITTRLDVCEEEACVGACKGAWLEARRSFCLYGYMMDVVQSR